MRRLLLIWLIAVLTVYVWASTQAVLHPLNTGTERQWAIGWLIVASIVVLFPSPRWLVLGTAISGAIVILSGSVASLACAMAILLSAWWGGQAVTGRRHPVLTVPIGLGVLALVALGFGLSGWTTPAALWSTLIVVAAPRLLRPARGASGIVVQALEREERTLLILCAVPWLFNLTWAVAPEIQYDALNYHLAVPRLYLEQGRVFEVPWFFHSYFIHSMDFIFLVALGISGVTAVKLVVLLLGVLAAASVYVLGNLTFGPRVARWSAALFYTTPLVAWASTTAYVDTMIVLLTVAAFVAFFEWRLTREPSDLHTTGLLAGVALGAKLTAAYGLPVLAAALLWRGRRRVRHLVWAGILFTVAAGPWYLWIYHYTGNPVFPMLNALFHSPKWLWRNETFGAAAFGVGTSAHQIIRLPFDLTVHSERFAEAVSHGALGIAALLACPLVLVLLRRSWPARFLLTASLVYLAFWTIVFQYGRFYLPIAPVLIVLGVAAVASFGAERLLLVAVLAQVAVVPVQFWNIPERLPIAVAFGREPDSTFLRRALATYNGAAFVNARTRGAEHVLGVGADNLRFYVHAPLESIPESLPGSALRQAAALPVGPALADALWRLQFRYLIVAHAAAAARFTIVQPDFLGRFAVEEYHDAVVTVYRLIEPASP